MYEALSSATSGHLITVDELAASWPRPLTDCPDPVMLLTLAPAPVGEKPDLRIVAANAPAAYSHNIPAADLVGRNILELHPKLADSGLFVAALRTAETGRPGSFDDVPFYDPGTDRLLCRTVRMAAATGAGEVAVAWRTTSEEQDVLAGLTRTTALLTALLSNRHGMVVLTDGHTNLWTSPGGATLLGGRRLPADMFEAVHPSDVDAVRSAFDTAHAGHPTSLLVRLRHLDGHWLTVDSDISPFRTADGHTAVLITMRDLTDALDTHAALTQQRNRADELTRTVSAFATRDRGSVLDPLTGLPGRAAALRMLADALSRRRGPRHVGLLVVDMDGFADINESFTVVAGDDVLCELARRISSVLRPGDRLARVGGDSFAVIRPPAAAAELDELANAIASAVRADLYVDARRVTLTASSGTVLAINGETAEELLLRAEAVAARAKAAGRDIHLTYDVGMAHGARERIAVEDELRTGIPSGQIVAFYQPIVDLSTSTIVAYEALGRWQHPHRGLLAPAAFMPIAELSDLICAVDAAMFDTVTAALAAHPAHLPAASINLSPRDLAHPEHVAALLALTDARGVAPHRVTVEVTETAALTLTDAARDSLTQLRDAGVGIHVDDFGTGFSSLSLLVDLPVTGVKLDRRFTAALTDGDRSTHALAEGLATLVRGLELDGVAEGVETAEQARILAAMGWPLAQGYLFGKPGPLPPT
jgi:diguanylate cyclase (GGDEF)-like protein